jgi:hypothetical protein
MDVKLVATVCAAVRKTVAVGAADARIRDLSATVAIWCCGGSKPPLNPSRTAANLEISCSECLINKFSTITNYINKLFIYTMSFKLFMHLQ